MCLDFMSSVKRIPDVGVDHAVADLGGSAELYEKVFRLVLRLIPQNIAQMDKHLYEKDDVGGFGIKVHGTKGSLNQVGNKKLAKCAETLEKAAKAGDKNYCVEYYGDFKKQLLLFCSQVEAVIAKDGGQEKNKKKENEPTDNILDFLDSFIKAREAIENYDSIAALDILSPLGKKSFGAKADILVAATVEALEIFKLQTALEYILELQKEYANV